MAQGFECVGMDAIKRQFDMYKDCPFYAVFSRKPTAGGPHRLIFAYKDGDKDEGWQELQVNLQALDQSAPMVPHVIQFYDSLGKGDKLDTGTPYAGSFDFRMKPYLPGAQVSGAGQISGVGGTSAEFLNYLQTELLHAKDENRDLKEQVEELEEELRELEAKPEGKEIGGVIGQIGEAGNQFPWLAEIIKDWSTVIKHKVTGGGGSGSSGHHHHAHTHHAHAGGGIAGVATDAPPDVRTNHAIKTMVNWYVQEYGQGGATPEEKKMLGFSKFADDMQLLARLTEDTDMMHLALKKLRALE